MKKPYFYFSEVQSAGQLRQLFKLRYRTYQSSRLRGFLEENKHEMDLDGYDLRSRHFGLFEAGEGAADPVGHLRVIQDHDGPNRERVLRVARETGFDPAMLEQAPSEPFPLILFHKDDRVLQHLYRGCRERGASLVEASRLCIAAPVASPELMAFVMHSAMAIYLLVLGCDYAMMACSPNHTPFYRIAGWRKFPNVPPFDIHGVRLIPMMITRTQIAAPLAPTVELMAQAYRETGRICFYPHSRGHFLPPDEQEPGSLKADQFAMPPIE
ncbi:MAG TPA: hypothetical protein PKV71_17030 [Calditrichia bacterium]|nr:hypothetical protein [Calditrichota bacterium]HQU72032.1 hypothetical protein [Calditrichia bacterium]HQV33591.1 hypothetical protein [Calditrichia bacterium]